MNASPYWTRIVSTGHALPSHVVSNEALSESLDTSDAWIRSRTGIVQRHVASPEESTTSLACQAARQALETAGCAVDDVDAIVVATSTPDTAFPSVACRVQGALQGQRPIPAWDLNAACSGFMYAFVLVDKLIRSGHFQRVLLVGSDVMSRLVDWTDRRTAVLFGDGAGAMLLSASDAPGVVTTLWQAQGAQADMLHVDRQGYIQMQGREVFKAAVQSMDDTVNTLRSAVQAATGDSHLDWLVPHQANIRIMEALAKRMALPLEQVLITVDQHGNTSAASIPLALHWGMSTGRVQPGQSVLLTSFGAGSTWGGAWLTL